MRVQKHYRMTRAYVSGKLLIQFKFNKSLAGHNRKICHVKQEEVRAHGRHVEERERNSELRKAANHLFLRRRFSAPHDKDDCNPSFVFVMIKLFYRHERKFE